MPDWAGMVAIIGAVASAMSLKWRHDSELFDRMSKRISKLEADLERERRDCERRIDELLERFRRLEQQGKGRRALLTPPPHKPAPAAASAPLALVDGSDDETG